MKVKECMCNNVIWVKPDTKLIEVAKLMQQNHIGCVPVCDENNYICGIVTDRDILLRSICAGKDPSYTNTSDVMSSNVCTCTQEDEITKVEDLMSQNKIRRLPVCDDNNKIVGILTLGNLTENDNKIGKENLCTTISNICDCHTDKNAE